MKKTINYIIIVGILFVSFFISSCNCVEREYYSYPDSLKILYKTNDSVEYANLNGDTAVFRITHRYEFESIAKKRIFRCNTSKFYETEIIDYRADYFYFMLKVGGIKKYKSTLGYIYFRMSEKLINEDIYYELVDFNNIVFVKYIGNIDTFSNVYKIIANKWIYSDGVAIESNKENHIYFNFPYGIISFTTSQDSFYISGVWRNELKKKNNLSN